MGHLRDLIKPKTRIKHNVVYETVWIDTFETTREGEKVFGECRYPSKKKPNERKQIVLSADQTDREAFKTYMHEVLHAIEVEYKIRIPHRVVDVLETAFYRFLKLNGWIK
jgi:hypothetical protein